MGLASILDNLFVVCDFHDGEWTWYNPSWPAEFNTLTTLCRGRGYWVKVCCGCCLEYDTKTYDLDEGWNLIGWVGW